MASPLAEIPWRLGSGRPHARRRRVRLADRSSVRACETGQTTGRVPGACQGVWGRPPRVGRRAVLRAEDHQGLVVLPCDLGEFGLRGQEDRTGLVQEFRRRRGRDLGRHETIGVDADRIEVNLHGNAFLSLVRPRVFRNRKQVACHQCEANSHRPKDAASRTGRDKRVCGITGPTTSPLSLVPLSLTREQCVASPGRRAPFTRERFLQADSKHAEVGREESVRIAGRREI